MKLRLGFTSLLLLALFLDPTALASSTWYADGVHGSDSHSCKSRHTACKTIGHAISLASSGDSVMVADATYSENLTIGFSLKVIGSSPTTTIIDGGGVNTVVTILNANTHVTLSEMTVRNGRSGRPYYRGGGIYNTGTLRVINSTISGNLATNTPLGAHGGGIFNGGMLTINNSTVSGNSASSHCEQPCYAFGGGIVNTGTLTIGNSTISGNSASVDCAVGCYALGGGISNTDTGALTINNGTLNRNRASSGGGGIYNLGKATPQNTIVANSPSGGNCYGSMNSHGYNLSSDTTCNFNNTGDLNNIDPKLGQLGNYGGPTLTIPLLSGSPAIDAGNPGGCTDGSGHLLKTDQRSKPRHDKEDTGGCDMGAYERQSD